MTPFTPAPSPPVVSRFLALGDSFTEGLNDAQRPDGRHRGWADRFAEELNNAYPGLEYANLAVRGKKVEQVLREQVPVALSMRPDLVSLAVGVNDALRPRASMAEVAHSLRSAVELLREQDVRVLLFSFGDPSRRSRAMSAVRPRLCEYRELTLSIASAYDCTVVDFWGRAVFDDDRYWSVDRLHLSPEGHALAAQAALHAMGLTDEGWITPRAPSAPTRLPRRITGHMVWAGSHLTPWMMRRVRRVSSGDGVVAKQPQWVRVTINETYDGDPPAGDSQPV
jgi:lysophospholipase L1-like esterase